MKYSLDQLIPKNTGILQHDYMIKQLLLSLVLHYTSFPTFKAGREGREGYTKRFKKPGTSSTNDEKKKKKNFMMVREKMKQKQKRSYRDKTVSLSLYHMIMSMYIFDKGVLIP